jgi:acyl-CoA reductase-like NAD-dependent aldehyde dehydrogenase
MAILGAKKFQNYIDGEWVDAASGATFESTSPANGETIGVFPKSGLEDVDHAVAAAKAAYESGGSSRRRSAAKCSSASRSCSPSTRTTSPS